MAALLTKLRQRSDIAVPGAILIALIAICFLGPVVFPIAGPNDGSLLDAFLGPFARGHVLGTDGTGNDMLSRCLYGGRVSLEVSAGAVFVGLLTGGSLGTVAAYIGGWLETVVMRTFDMLLAFPPLILVLAISSYLGETQLNVTFAIAVFTMTNYARLARAATLKVRSQTFILAARLQGRTHISILAGHVIPHVLPQLLTLGVILVGQAILIEGALDFLGFGVPPPTPSWGSMIASGQTQLGTDPWLVLVPSFFIFVAVWALNSFGDALRVERPATLRRAGAGARAALPRQTPDRSRSDGALLRLTDLAVTFATPAGDVQAVSEISIDVPAGEIVALVGESGSGKSATARAIMGLLPASAEVRGSIRLNGRELTGLPDREMRVHRGRDIAMVFQDPARSLNPTFRIGEHVLEAVQAHGDADGQAARARAIELLELVRIPSAAERYRQFPHELSGGMRQRVMIAAAIASHPSVLIADEATTALDVTTQAEIMDLIAEVQASLGMGIVLITHDLRLAERYANRIAVMYRGRIVEVAATPDLFASPTMPYTQALINAIPGRTA